MKKLLALLLALLMVFTLVACGKTEAPVVDEPEVEAPVEEEPEVEAPVEEEPEVEAPAIEAVPVENVKIGAILVHDENSGYDMAHIEGLNKAAEALGIDPASINYKYNIPEDESCYDAAAELADDGCNIIFSDSYGHQTFMAQAAEEFPDIIFVACTGDQAAGTGLANLKNIFPFTYESRYVSGLVAGMKLKEMMDAGEVSDPHVGYVGAFPYDEVVSGYTAFYLGIRSIVPEAYMEVQYTNSWYDPVAESEAAIALMGRGCVIIGQHADSTGAPSAVQAEWEKGSKVYSVGYNIDMLAVAPDAALTSAQNEWSVLYEATLKKFIEGKEIPTDYACGISKGAQKISPLGPNVAAGTQEAVDAAWSKIINGNLFVFHTNSFKVEGQTVSTAYALDTDGDWVKDSKNAVMNGIFMESYHRSAPYFGLRIDGITELNAG